MRVLVACEESQVVCKAFRERGHEAYSCDLQPCSGGHPEWHVQGDVLNILEPKKPNCFAAVAPGPRKMVRFKTMDGMPHEIENWDLMIAHPPCTYLCNSGVRWLYNEDGSWNHERKNNMYKAVSFFWRLLTADIPKIAVENPIPHKHAMLPNYSQIIQPWMFGHGETKATCLWLRGLPKLKPTEITEVREGKVWKMPPSKDRSKLRSKTYEGIAKAMARQWG